MKNIKHIIAASIIIAALFCGISYSQVTTGCSPNCASNDTLNISTGVDQNGNLLPVGTVDPFWLLLNIPPYNGPTVSSIAVPNAHIIHNNDGNVNSSWNNVSGARILSALDTTGFNYNNLSASQPWKFRRQFCVCSPCTVRIKGNFRVDDEGSVRIVSAGGTTVFYFATPTPASTANFYSNHLFDTTVVLAPGTYFARVDMININSVAMGFALNLKLTTNQNTLLNPASGCCDPSQMISGQIGIDNDCNDIVDQAGANWTVQLLSGNTVIQSTTSDAYGEFSFTNLAAGTYSIVVTNPSGTSLPPQSVSVPGQTPVQFVQLTSSNCSSTPPDTCCSIPNLDYFVELNDNNLDLVVTTPNTQIQEIEISVIDYHVEYSQPDCKPVNMGSYGILSSNANGVGSLQLDASTNNSNNLVWRGSPSSMNQTHIPFSISKPNVLNISCCKMKFSYCLKITFKDSQCRMCEKIICPLDWTLLNQKNYMTGNDDPVNTALNEGRARMSRTPFGEDVNNWYFSLNEKQWIAGMLKKYPDDVKSLLAVGRKLIQQNGKLTSDDITKIEKTLKILDREFVPAPKGFIDEAMKRIRSSEGKTWEQLLNALVK